VAILAPVTIRADVNEERLVNMSDAQVTPPVSGDAPSDTGKLLVAIGYLIWPLALVAILIEPYKNEKFVRLHGIQALALAIIGVVAYVVNVIPLLGQIVFAVVELGVFVFAIMGLVKAIQSEYWEMPLVYKFIAKYV